MKCLSGSLKLGRVWKLSEDLSKRVVVSRIEKRGEDTYCNL